MIKKIKIVNYGDTFTDQFGLRDTTLDSEYQVTVVDKGSKCPDGLTAIEDTLSFLDDVGEWVSIFVGDTTYEIVEEYQSMTNNNQVNWDEIPEDVEAVVTFENDAPSYYKTVNNKLMVQCYRKDTFDNSFHGSVESAIEYFEDRWHSRPSPTSQPIPLPPESTQVESSEVEATTTSEFDWSSVDDDVEAVILHKGTVVQHLKTDYYYGQLLMDILLGDGWEDSCYKTLKERELHIKAYGDGTATLIRRPPATTTPQDIGLNEAYDTYKKVAAEVDKIGEYIKPSISTILQEAQQSILKHHGVTGKVKFTVTCSE